MNEGDHLKRILVLCLVVLMIAGCAKEEKTVKSAYIGAVATLARSCSDTVSGK